MPEFCLNPFYLFLTEVFKYIIYVSIFRGVFIMSSKSPSKNNSKNIKKQDNSTTIIIVLLICILCVIAFTSISIKNRKAAEAAAAISENSADSQKTEEEDSETETEPQPVVFDAVVNPTYYADIEIKDYGTITVALDSNIAPKSVANFVKLAKDGFYSGLTFHRIMEGFMMQGGASPAGPSEKIKGEFYANGVENRLSHKRGVISMARADDYNSGNSQFFIVHKDSTSLDGIYAAFGVVTEGMDVVDKICETSNPTDKNGTIPAAEQPVIVSITVRDAD